jgi:U-box domain
MVSIVRDATGRQRRDAASKVLKILRSLASQKIATYSKRLEALKSYFPRATYREGIEVCISEIEKLKAVINGLGTHEQALCDFLIYRAVNSTAVDSPWTWVVGDSIPRVLKTPSDFSASLLSEEMTAIPLDYLCPISKEIMENPVRTSDGFTFERGSIET